MLPILGQLAILRPFLVTGKLGGVAEWISVLADMRHHVACARYVTAQGMSGSFELTTINEQCSLMPYKSTTQTASQPLTQSSQSTIPGANKTRPMLCIA